MIERPYTLNTEMLGSVTVTRSIVEAAVFGIVHARQHHGIYY